MIKSRVTVKSLERKYSNVCFEIVEKFCVKQDVEFGGWVAGHVGEVAHISDFTLNFSDICYDLFSKQPVGLIFTWDYDGIDNSPKYINYPSYSKGLRYSQI